MNNFATETSPKVKIGLGRATCQTSQRCDQQKTKAGHLSHFGLVKKLQSGGPKPNQSSNYLQGETNHINGVNGQENSGPIYKQNWAIIVLSVDALWHDAGIAKERGHVHETIEGCGDEGVPGRQSI